MSIEDLTTRIAEILKIPPRKRSDDEKSELTQARAERKRLKWNAYIAQYGKAKRKNFKRMNTAVQGVCRRLERDKQAFERLQQENRELKKEIESYKVKLVRLTEKLID